ncbi:MAG: hypothetical protein ACRDGR_02775, partial [bacterium]
MPNLVTRALVACVVAGSLSGSGSISGARAESRASLGDARVVEAAYARWREHRGGIVVPLGWSRALSRERTAAAGTATIDLDAGSVAVQVWGLPAGTRREVWLVDNARGSGRSAAPEAGDAWTR